MLPDGREVLSLATEFGSELRIYVLKIMRLYEYLATFVIWTGS